MGLAEHIKAGARLTRDIVTVNDTVGSGSIQLGATFCIISIQNDNITSPVRIRLYDTSASMEDATEKNRVFDSNGIPAPITLIGDFTMSAGGLYSIDPVLFGHSRVLQTPTTYYRMEPSGSSVKINRYLLEDSTIPVLTNTAYDTSNRRHIPSITGSLAPGASVSGIIASPTIPTTYLLISASLSSSYHLARVRVYSTASSIYNTQELDRPFNTEPSASVRLIADMIISGSQNVSFTPKILGVNLQNLGTSLNDIKKSETLISGEQEIYYTLQNVSGSGGTVAISASLYVYALEG